MQIRREVVGALAALLLTACAAAAAGPDDTVARSVPSMVGGVGVLPQPLATTQSLAPTTAGTDVTTSASTTVPATTTTAALLAEGNRVLLLGDSILASTARRHSNDACKALVPLGWKVEVEAEVSRGIDFGNTVLASRKKAGWDVGVVLLGTNNGGTEPNVYLRELNKIITAFAPSPVVLITITEFRPEIKSINDTIRAIAQVYPDRVRIVDWNQITQSRPEILNTDGIHPTPEGRQVLAEAIAAQLGTAPTAPGDCLESVFTDDSAGSIDGKGGSSGSTATTVKPRNTQPTNPGASTTTIKPGGTPTTVKPSSTTTIGGTGSTTAPGSTTPPATYGTVAPTSPPQTSPPQTSPPTAAPTTVGP